jgi:hypothetical protein
MKKKIKTIKITYKAIGTPKERQEAMDRVFDIIFEEVIKQRATKK